jgi:hypothetical protein
MSLLVPYPRNVKYSRCWTEGRPATTTGVTVTAHATSHTLGNKVEVFAATAFDTTWVKICPFQTAGSATQTDMLVNIYIGAGGSEKVLIANLAAGWSARVSKVYEFPLFIPAGTRISADCQALISADTVEILMELQGGGERGWVGSGVETLGATTASSQGTTVTTGTTGEGSFVDIGTTGKEWRYILPMAHSCPSDTNVAIQNVACDIGVGGAIYKELEEFWFSIADYEGISTTLGSRGRYVVIPSGTALQMRGQTLHTSSEPIDALIYGVY